MTGLTSTSLLRKCHFKEYICMIDDDIIKGIQIQGKAEEGNHFSVSAIDIWNSDEKSLH